MQLWRKYSRQLKRAHKSTLTRFLCLLQTVYNLSETQPSLSEFQYVIDPQFDKFLGYGYTRTFYEDETHLDIHVSERVLCGSVMHCGSGHMYHGSSAFCLKKTHVFCFLQGKDIDLVDITGDLRVSVGDTKCNVTKIGYNVVICAPKRPDVFTDHEPSQRVLVRDLRGTVSSNLPMTRIWYSSCLGFPQLGLAN